MIKIKNQRWILKFEEQKAKMVFLGYKIPNQTTSWVPQTCQLWGSSKVWNLRNQPDTVGGFFHLVFRFLNFSDVTGSNDYMSRFSCIFLVGVYSALFQEILGQCQGFEWRIRMKLIPYNALVLLSFTIFICYLSRIFSDADSKNSWICLCCFVLFYHPHRSFTNRPFRRWIC